MSYFSLDSRLENDCHILGQFDDSLLLLMDNSLVPWFILVPRVDVTELYELDRDNQLQVLDQINLVSNHIKQEFSVDKINVAAIGNIVRQMHIHVVGRSETDYCWPNVVWGAEGRKTYLEQEVGDMVASVRQGLGDRFVPA